MTEGVTQEPLLTSAPAPPDRVPSRMPTGFLIASGVLVLAFAKALFDLVAYSLKVDLHSHALLIPVISGYLIHQERLKLPAPKREFSIAALLCWIAGAGAAGAYFWLRNSGAALTAPDSLALTIFSFVALFWGIVLYYFGVRFSWAIAFPLGFLIFLVPFPKAVQDGIEIASQHASADVFAWMLDATFMTYFRDGQIFQMPGLSLVVAQECSGVRSSFVLFITSLLAGYMFLKSPMRRALLALFVFPLALVRNAFRIWTLSVLTIYWDPSVIHSPLHHRGGPIFFALSLIPFFGVLYLLRRAEAKKEAANPGNPRL